MPSSELNARRLHKVVYSSLFTGRPGDLDQVLAKVIAKSIQNNRLVNVTGFLVAGGGSFLQLLEGPAQAVRETYARILGDPRHAGVNLIIDAPAESRLFRDWNMGKHRIMPDDEALVGEDGLQGFSSGSWDGLRAERVLTRLGQQHLR